MVWGAEAPRGESWRGVQGTVGTAGQLPAGFHMLGGPFSHSAHLGAEGAGGFGAGDVAGRMPGVRGRRRAEGLRPGLETRRGDGGVTRPFGSRGSGRGSKPQVESPLWGPGPDIRASPLTRPPYPRPPLSSPGRDLPGLQGAVPGGLCEAAAPGPLRLPFVPGHVRGGPHAEVGQPSRR